MLPHPSATSPQFFDPHDPVGVQPQTPDAPHVAPVPLHPPQWSVPPQPSD